MKTDTIGQFKVLEYIKANFELEYITITKKDKNSLEVTDRKGESIIFTYDSSSRDVYPI